MRRRVFGLSGRFRYLGSSSSERPKFSQLMISRAPRQGRRPGNMPVLPFACDGSGHTTGRPSFRASRKNLVRVVASPKSAAFSIRHSA